MLELLNRIDNLLGLVGTVTFVCVVLAAAFGEKVGHDD